jgi:hypothetical protein
VAIVAQNRRPAAGAGIAQAGAIGDELNFFHKIGFTKSLSRNRV